MMTASHLSKTEIESLSRQLERQLTRALRSIEGLGATSASIMETKDDDDGIGQLEAMTSQNVLGHLAERDRVRVEILRDALKRVRNGSYGLCTKCGTEIPFGRLDVVPETERCVTCT